MVRLVRRIRDAYTRGPYRGPLWLCLLVLGYAVVVTVAPPPIGGNGAGEFCRGLGETDLCLCARETICVGDSIRQAVFLAFSRFSAYHNYPLYMLLFVTKMRFLQRVLCQAHLVFVFPFLQNFHGLHTFAGTVVMFENFWHASWHIVRWQLESSMPKGSTIADNPTVFYFLFQTWTGVTGMLMLMVILPIAGMMSIPAWRERFSFSKTRKGLHYLFLVYAICLCFHAEHTKVFYLIGAPFLLYLVDALLFYLMSTFGTSDLRLNRLSHNLMSLSWKIPKGWSGIRTGGTVYICIPAVTTRQWHAFSFYEDEEERDEDQSGVISALLLVVGDWTGAVHALATKPDTILEGFISGPVVLLDIHSTKTSSNRITSLRNVQNAVRAQSLTMET